MGHPVSRSGFAEPEPEVPIWSPLANPGHVRQTRFALNNCGLAAGNPAASDDLICTHAAPIDPRRAPLAINGGPTQTQALCTAAGAHAASCAAVSPAINAGNNSLLPTDALDFDGDGDTVELIPFDQRGLGFDRIFNTIVDIGAFESQPTFLWHRFENQVDVRDGPNNQPDGHVVADDVIAIINYINAKGSGPIPANAAVGIPFGFLDTEKDNKKLVASDVIAVINFINAHPCVSEAEAASSFAASPANPSVDEILLLIATNTARQGRRTRRGGYLATRRFGAECQSPQSTSCSCQNWVA
jgi:hypothetical protein